MTVASVQARLSASLPSLLIWLRSRATEPSTWIGLGMAATSLGYSTLGKHLTAVSDFLPMILGAGGAALATASTSVRPAVGQLQQPSSAPTSA